MGSFANSLFKILLGWLQGAVSAVWSAFTNEKGNSLFNWIGRNWLLIAGILCVIGLAADLCVYLFRWKPFKVWKSFLSGNSKKFEEPEYEEQEAFSADNTSRPVRQPRRDPVPEPVPAYHDKRIQEPDFSQWDDEAEKQNQTDIQPAEKPAMVTNAGYIVPEDSPYRRPAEKTHTNILPAAENERTESQAAGPDRNEQNPVAPRRRKRVNVAELFTDPEEELKQFDAPQNVIDSRRAYREPVYPSGWKKSEDKEE